MRPTVRRAAGFAAACIAVLGAVSCGGESSTGPHPSMATASLQEGDCALPQPKMSGQQGEVFGSIYVNGERDCTEHMIWLTPQSDAQSRLHMPSFSHALESNPYWMDMWEFWDPLASAPCAGSSGLSSYLASGAAYPEAIHASSNPIEGHCVRPGHYQFSLDEGTKTFPVEYIQWSGTNASNSAAGLTEAIESPTYSATSTNSWQDLVINVDLGTAHPGDTPHLDIQNAHAAWDAPSFADAANQSGTAADWFRFSAARSTSNWAGDSKGKALARLFFDGTDLGQATAYYDYIPEGRPVLRLHRFPNPSTASKVYTVGLDLMRPDEAPSNTPSITRTVTITRLNPDLQVGTVSGPGSAYTGDPIQVSVQEKNAATNSFAVAEGGWTGRLYLSSDQTFSTTSDYLIGSYNESSTIAASSTLTRSYSGTIPGTLTAGTYYIFVVVDATAAVLESSETNNTSTSPPALAVSVLPPPSITNFATTHCELTSKGWPNITFSWSKSGNWTGTSWEMYWGSTPTSISLATSGPGTVTSTTKAISPVADHKYVFIRTVRSGVAGSWVALDGNPVDVTHGCDGIGDL